MPQLEALAEALLDFSTLADLEAWLTAQDGDSPIGDRDRTSGI